MRVRVVVASAVLAVLSVGIVPAFGSGPADARSTGCPDAPVALRDIMALQGERGPLATRFPPAVAWINERGSECLGGSTLRFRAFVNRPGGIGGTSAYEMRPGWFLDPALIVFATDQEVEPGVGDGPFYGIAVPAGFGDVQERYARSWVTVEAHFRDARAGTCRATGAPAETPSRRQAIRICQSVLVLSAIRRGTGVASPDTATGPTGATQTPLPLAIVAGVMGMWLWRRRARRHRGASRPSAHP